jgi:hypothetical protein
MMAATAQPYYIKKDGNHWDIKPETFLWPCHTSIESDCEDEGLGKCVKHEFARSLGSCLDGMSICDGFCTIFYITPRPHPSPTPN